MSLKGCDTASVDEPGSVFSPQSKVELKDAVDACVDFVPEGNSENSSLLEEYEKKFSPADPAEIKELNQEYLNQLSGGRKKNMGKRYKMLHTILHGKKYS